MYFKNPLKLSGQFIELESLRVEHREELRPVAQDESIWTYFPHAASGALFDNWFEKTMRAQTNDQQLAFAVRSKTDNKIIGSTRYYEVDPKHRRLRIGHTWYVVEARGTTVNPECKLLLLQHAFEELNVNRVEFTVDARNARSIAAIKKLGAVEEGNLRQYQILEDGYLRDTIMLSILQCEWPELKAKLQKRCYDAILK